VLLSLQAVRGGLPGGKFAVVAIRELLSRITADSKIFGGKPIIRGMRISVELVLSLLAQGESAAEILDDYPDLEAEDIQACLAYRHAAIALDTLAAVQVGER